MASAINARGRKPPHLPFAGPYRVTGKTERVVMWARGRLIAMALAAAISGCGTNHHPPPANPNELTPTGTPLVGDSDLSSTGPGQYSATSGQPNSYTELVQDQLAQTRANSPATRRELKDVEKKAIEEAVGEHLIDPFSAHFKWPEYIGVLESGTYCGYVNAKNLYGACVGSTKYYVEFIKGTKESGPLATFGRIADSDPSSSDSSMVETMCWRYILGDA